MKKKPSLFIILCLCLSVFTLGLTGCASTSSRESTGQYIDSTAITTKIKAKLAKDVSIGSIKTIEVTTYKGVVQLSGFVNTQAEIRRAVRIAKSVKGVTAVENSLLVKRQIK